MFRGRSRNYDLPQKMIPAFGKRGNTIKARCHYCGQPILSSESWMGNGFFYAHLRCHYKAGGGAKP
jgi:hypothetical protein